jgi:formylglycine-generating enzyme required for sulfatase activity
VTQRIRESTIRWATWIALGLGMISIGFWSWADGKEITDAARRLRAQAAQAQAAKAKGIPVALTVKLADKVEMAFRLVPPGSFARARRTARITRPFYIGVHEVTQAQWEAVTGSNPSYFKDRDDSANRPVERVSWNDIMQRFLPAVQAHAPRGMRFRLPSEAEWEHACRAGTLTSWSFGKRVTPELANTIASDLRQTVPVGSYPANAWGLYDMHGNVSEWCRDWYDAGYYQRAPANDPVNRKKPKNDRKRVMRGGSWLNDAYNTRSTERLRHFPEYRNINTGVRLVLDLDISERTE